MESKADYLATTTTLGTTTVLVLEFGIIVDEQY